MLFFQLRHRVVDRICLPVAARAPVIVHQQIPGDAGEPRRESSKRWFVARQRLVQAEKNLLAQVLGLRRIAGEPVAKVEHSPRMSPNGFLPGRPFAPETLLYQLGVGLQSSLASHPSFLSASHNETQTSPKKFPAVCGSERSCKPLWYHST